MFSGDISFAPMLKVPNSSLIGSWPICISPDFLDSLGHIGAHFWGRSFARECWYDKKMPVVFRAYEGKSVIGGDPVLGDDFAHLY